jgi:putative membrane protein
MPLAEALVSASASATVVSLICAALAYRAIRRRQIERHKRLMIAAVAASAIFLALFVYRFVRFGFAPPHFEGAGLVVFRIIFFSHEPIAVVSVPLVLAAAILGLSRSYKAHREIARVALPIWAFSMVTGITLYALLYS